MWNKIMLVALLFLVSGCNTEKKEQEEERRCPDASHVECTVPVWQGGGKGGGRGRGRIRTYL